MWTEDVRGRDVSLDAVGREWNIGDDVCGLQHDCRLRRQSTRRAMAPLSTWFGRDAVSTVQRLTHSSEAHWVG